MSREEASLFFRLISHRYLRGATIITTNKSIRPRDSHLGAGFLSGTFNETVMVGL